MKLKNPKAIIVWDFDGVLFETNRYRLDNRGVFEKLGIPPARVLLADEHARKYNKYFSISAFAKALRAHKIFLSKRTVRRVFHSNLAEQQYYDRRVDRMLHRFREKGFTQMILSLGNAAFQYKKMQSCGTAFPNHFQKICVTTRPKYLALRKTKRQHREIPLIFVDDTRENLALAKKHVPGIFTIYYSNKSGHALHILERKILKYAKRKK